MRSSALAVHLHRSAAGAVLVALALGGAVAGCRGEQKAAAPPPRPVRVAAVETHSARDGVPYSASIRPATQVELAFKVGGYVDRLLQIKGPDGRTRTVQEGDSVTKGTVLAEVSQGDYRVRLAQAGAQLSEAHAAQETAAFQLNAARTGLAQVRLELDRAQSLLDAKSLTRADYDATRSRHDEAQARVDGAGSQVEAARARVAGAQAQIREAELTLGDTVLRAPMDGVVIKRRIEVGSLAGAGTVAFVVADIQSVKAVFGVPDLVVAELRLGQSVTLTSAAASLRRGGQGHLPRHPIAERVRDDWGAPSFSVRLQIDPAGANLAGVSNLEVAQASVAGITGMQVTTLREGDKQIPVVARLRMEERAQLADVGNLYVYSSDGRQRIRVREVTTIEQEMRTEKIARRDQFRTITVGAFPVEGVLASQVFNAAQPALEALGRRLPPGYKMEIGGEQEEEANGFQELAIVLGISVALIYLALTFQFKNAVKPFIVFAAIPYGVVGALAALWVMNAPFGFMGFLGIVSLVGIIVSHVIVVFDFIEEAHARGESFEDSLLDAGILRSRPVPHPSTGEASAAPPPLLPDRLARARARSGAPPRS